jgi:hypothetical protein
VTGDSNDFSIKYLVVHARNTTADTLESAAPASPPATPGEIRLEEETPEPLSPPSELEDMLDIDHDDAPLRLRSLDSVIGPATLPGLAVRELEEELYTEC